MRRTADYPTAAVATAAAAAAAAAFAGCAAACHAAVAVVPPLHCATSRVSSIASAAASDAGAVLRPALHRSFEKAVRRAGGSVQLDVSGPGHGGEKRIGGSHYHLRRTTDYPTAAVAAIAANFTAATVCPASVRTAYTIASVSTIAAAAASDTGAVLRPALHRSFEKAV